jgi:hypothetical protein
MSALTRAGFAVNMHGTSAWRDDVFVERMWRTSSTTKSI